MVVVVVVVPSCLGRQVLLKSRVALGGFEKAFHRTVSRTFTDGDFPTWQWERRNLTIRLQACVSDRRLT